MLRLGKTTSACSRFSPSQYNGPDRHYPYPSRHSLRKQLLMPLQIIHRVDDAARVLRSGLGLLLAFCLMSMQMLATTAIAAENDSMQKVEIMTYNIRYLNPNDGPDQWMHRAETVAEVIRRGDIVGLQEATRPQIDDLTMMLTDFDWYGVGRDDAKDRGEFSPIFWRSSRFEAIDRGTFWLGPDPQAVGQPAWGARIPRICSWVVLRSRADAAEQPTLLVMNTHFDHQSEEARINSARLLRQKAQQLAGEHVVIVMGDLNARPDSQAIATLTDASEEFTLADTIARSESPPQGSTGTWNAFKQIDPQTRIDYIFTSADGPRILAHRTADPKTPAGRFASDHLPVSVTLELGK